MGNIADKLKEKYGNVTLKQYKSLMNLTIEKIKKLHGIFKSICEGFAINLTDYSQLFGANESTFGVWATEDLSFVDALELFSGLLLYANARPEDRIKLIFELFDFNEIESLSVTDLEYMLECCITGSCKLHGLPLAIFNSVELAKYVNDVFDPDKRVTFPQLIKWCANDASVGIFFRIFQIPEVERRYVTKMDRQLALAAENIINPEALQSVANVVPSALFRTRRFTEYVNWLSEARDTTMNRATEVPEGGETERPEVSTELRWVYGININTSPPIQYAALRNMYAKPDVKDVQLVYSCGAAVLVYNPNTHHQQYYLEHKHSISSICVSANRKWVASAEHNGASAKATIHIWNAADMSNVVVLTASHRGPILSMVFTGFDQYLITIGALRPTPLIMYKWASNIVETSAVIADVPIGLETLDNDETVVIITQTKIIECRIPELREYCLLQEHAAKLKQEVITAGTLIHTSNTMPHLVKPARDYVNTIGVTGHPDGTLCSWEEGKVPTKLAEYHSQISSIKQLPSEVAVATVSGHIFLWDIPARCTQVIDLSALDIKLISQAVVSLDAVGSRLLVATRGDVVQIDLKGEYQKPVARRYDKICFNTGAQKALAIIEPTSTTLYVGVGGDEGVIQIYDARNFSLVDIWRIGFNVTALHSVTAADVGCTVAAGTSNGMLYVMNYNDMDDYKLPCASGKILDLKISLPGTHLVAGSEDHYIYLFVLDHGKFVSSTARKLDAGCPISLTFSVDSQIILASTNRRGIIMMDTKELNVANYTSEDAKKCNWQQWNGRYAQHSKKSSAHIAPFAFSSKFPVMFAADEFGNFYTWNYQDDMPAYVLNNYHVHSAPIERLTLDSDETFFFSLSSLDSMLCQWSVNILNVANLQKGADVETQYRTGIEGVPETVTRELQYAYCPMGAPESKEETGHITDPTVLVKGSRNQRMNDLIVTEGIAKQFDSELKPPMGSLTLDRITGVQCGHRRNTVKYYHNTSKQEEAEGKSPSKESGGFHKNCVKFLCYYASRYVVLEDLNLNAQYIYEGHKARITCLVSHPTAQIFASGESAPGRSEVHVWDATTRETIVVLKTAHETGVALLDFSGDGNLLLTFGSGKQSLQVFNWQQEREIAFRHLNVAPILDIKFDPLDSHNIIAVGLECIVELALSSGSLSISNIIPFSPAAGIKRAFLCMDFLPISVASSTTTSVFIGCSTGQVGVLSGSKFNDLPDVRHDGAVNVIKITRSFIKPFSFITAGDDNLVKIWDSFMTCIATLVVSNFEIYKDMAARNNMSSPPDFGGIQSIDMYECEEEKRYILIVLRNGDILETNVITRAEDEKSVSAQNASAKPLKFIAETLMLASGHSSQGFREDERKISIALHPILPILVSGGYDCTLRFWDIMQNTLLTSIPLGKKLKVSALTFSPNGSMLTVGLTNGMVIFYAFSDAPKGAEMTRYEPQIEKTFSMRDSRGTVLLIKYSQDSEFIAISYDSEVTSVANPAGENVESKKDKSCVIVYVQSNSSRSPGVQKSKDPYGKFSQINFPIAHIESDRSSSLVPPAGSVPEPIMGGAQGSDGDRAFTHMDFTDQNTFLQLCYMPVSLHGKADYSKQPLCLVWDMKRLQVIEDWQAFREAEWYQWSMAPTVNARVLNDKLVASSFEEESELLAKESVTFTALTLFGKNNDLACAGSQSGDLHLFRGGAIWRENESLRPDKGAMMRKDSMDVAKSFSACCSSVDCIEVYRSTEPGYVLVSSSSDEVILKYRIEKENMKWDLDYCTPGEERVDPYAELPTPKRFNTIMNECWVPRSRMFELSEKLAPPPSPCDLRINWVFGRRAYDRHNNLFFDYLHRIVYHAGTMLFVLRENVVEESKDEHMFTEKRSTINSQKVFPSTRNVAAFTSPEISCMCSSANKHIVALGTSEAKAHIYVWDISHDTEVGGVALPNVSIVFCMKMNKDNRRVAAVGLNKDFLQVIMLVDVKQQEVLAMNTLIHSLPYKIRDIEFYPDSNCKLITAGIQHLTYWRVMGKYMEGRCAEFTIPKIKLAEDTAEAKQSAGTSSQAKCGAAKVCLAEQLAEAPNDDADSESVCVSFMGIGFIDSQTMLTIGDDGNIYIWDNEKLLKKRKAHDDCIMCMSICQETKLFVTGGNDGYVIIWMFNNANEPLNRDIIRKETLQIPTITGVITGALKLPSGAGGAILPAASCVQSVCIDSSSILVGTRNGSVHEIDFRYSQGELKILQQSDGTKFRRVLDAIDDEVPKCIAHDQRNKRLLSISQRGVLAVWNLETNLLFHCKNFDKPAIYLHVLTQQNMVLVAFENEVNMLSDKYEIMANFSIKKNLITAIKMSNNEKVVALASATSKTPELEIYDIENKFHEFHSIKGYKANITKIDFTADDKYMMCFDELNDCYLYDREKLERIERDTEDKTKLVWQGFGLIVDVEFAEFSRFYEASNEICTISRFPGKNIVAIGDQLGSVFDLIFIMTGEQLRLYKHPLEYARPYFVCRCDHLNWLSQCVINGEGSVMFSFSESDRCVIKWGILYKSEAM